MLLRYNWLLPKDTTIFTAGFAKNKTGSVKGSKDAIFHIKQNE